MAEPLVAVRGLAKRYGGKPAIADLSLRLGGGEILALLGANGGGKTTSLRLLSGLLAADAGEGQVLGMDLRRDPRAIRRQVGYLSQRFSLYPTLSVAENLRFRAEVYDLPAPVQAVDATIEAFGLDGFRHARAGSLSGGWARRLQFAAALIHRPRLVLLDEPTSGLDAVARQDIWRRIARLAAEDIGVVISTHDLADAERCGRALLLIDGRVAGAGTPSELAARCPARCFILSNLAGQGDRVEAIDGVIACHPVEASLRVLASSSAEAALRDFAERSGGRLVSVPPRLEDAVMAEIRGRA